MRMILTIGMLGVLFAGGCVSSPRTKDPQCSCCNEAKPSPVACPPGPAPVWPTEVNAANAHNKSHELWDEMDWISQHMQSAQPPARTPPQGNRR